MSLVAPFVPDRFQSTVPFYVAHRLRYPDALVVEVARKAGLARGDRVLDLGCGPGFLAIAFARTAGAAVLGIDPDAAMLSAATAAARAAAVDVGFQQASSYDLSPAMGAFRLVTMGRSFHWMDRAATLAALDAMVDRDGAVALFSDAHEKTRENRWRDVVREVQAEFTGPGFSERLRGGPDWDSHAAVLLDSPFSGLERIGIVERHTISVDEIVGRALSMSTSSPQALADRLGDFRARLRERLLVLADDGSLTELVEFSALIARRSL